tara:strand:- start:13 stop:213 length:201 start_codon:yes stop_codon:yes gene_type:complete
MGLSQPQLTRRDRIASIRKAIDTARATGKEIDKKKFVVEIMRKWFVGRKVANEYLVIALAAPEGGL